MPDFKPYIVIEDDNNRLYIKEAGWRNNLHFFIFRILPFFFLIEAVSMFVLTNKSEIPSAAFLFIILVTCIPAAILFTRKYLTAIELTPLSIELTRKSLRGKEQRAIAITDIDHLLQRKRNGKGGGYFYYMAYKNGKKERFITFPLFRMTDEKKLFINQKLKRVTGLEIRSK